ncbi:MAG: methyltransferase domain-containing protein [Micromonosporaceae bacterium]|nr:methyltransferase domain-containing protein [Micromonosporaceae bacterium]
MTWPEYLSRFHHERAGITETVLRRCVDQRGRTPYDWLGELTPDGGPVLDLACGSAPLWPTLSGHGYLGLDRSAAELAQAASRGAGPLVRADAAALPLAGGTVRLVVCAMALMLVAPLPHVLAEIARVLAPGGRLVAIVPATRPLAARDVPVAAGLLATLGRLPYPSDAPPADPTGVLAQAGLRLERDQAQRFSYRLTSRAEADTLLESLYLPSVSPPRVRAARAYLHTLARIGASVPVPIRRLLAISPT